MSSVVLLGQKVVLALQLCTAVHEHALEIMEGQMMQQDALMSQLAQELDNGRLLRLLSRLVIVSEGNQTSVEPNWSETGNQIWSSFSAATVCPQYSGFSPHR